MEANSVLKPHSCIMNDRKRLSLTGIYDIGSFDENIIVLYSDYGMINITGENMQIISIDTENGNFEAEGNFKGINYSDNKSKHQSFLSKVFR